MQKIKYPVGSKLKSPHFSRLITIGDLSKNEFLAAVFWVEDNNFIGWLTQENIDDCYTLVSTPRWIPEKGQKYWAIEALLEEIGMFEKIFTNNIVDKYFLKTENMFRTEEECKKKLDEINAREI